MSRAIERELSDVLWAAYRLGDDAQRTLVDIGFDTAQCAAGDLAARALEWTDEARESAVFLGIRGGLNLAWQQARNNLEVYNLVKDIRSRLDLDWSRGAHLAELVRRAYALGAYPDLWALEGLGHDYAAMRLERGATAGILTDAAAADCPADSLTMLHAGLGLALAERTLAQMRTCSSRSQVRAQLARFVDACNAHSRRGYAACAYESLGLVTRTWHPQMVRRVDSALCDLDEDLLGYFWHGAGRALYFLPAYIIPGVLSPWRAADREAPHHVGWHNLIAGLAWATMLVNIRHPQILAHLLRVRGTSLQRSDGFAGGIASATVVAADITPNDPFVREFAAYDPIGADEMVVVLWNRLVRPAVVVARDRYQPVLRKHEQLERVFRHCDLESIIAGLEHGEQLRAVSYETPAPAGPPIAPGRPSPPGLYPASGRTRQRSGS